MKQSVEIIGPTEVVDFPDLGIVGVPAKVDTGAYSTSVWASQIVEADGVLSFVLFDTQSPFYTGETITLHNFTSRSVRNSFGHAEQRYGVTLKLRLHGRIIRANVTLSNRTENRFPVLLGRRTLRGKFLIDVSSGKARATTHTLVLVPVVKPYTRAFFAGIERNIETHQRYTIASYDDLTFEMLGRRTRVTLPNGKDVSDFDAVYFKESVKNAAIAGAVAEYIAERGVPFFDSAVRLHAEKSKLHQYILLRARKFAVPESVFIAGKRLPESFARLSKTLGLPFILKDIHGKKGHHNYLVSDEKAYKDACDDSAADSEVQLIAQKFIPNDGDFRALVMGDDVELLIHRHANSKTHLNNTSAGGSAELVVDEATVPKAVRKAAVAMAEALGWNVAGVDVMQDKVSGKWYCLEVNKAPQLATGAFIPDKQAAFARFMANIAKKGE